jgi:general nucleoside transport system permease protein
MFDSIPLKQRRTQKLGLCCVIFGAAVLVGAVFTSSGTLSTLRFSTIGTLQIAARTVFLLWGLLSAIIGFLCFSPKRGPLIHRPVLILNSIGFLTVVLVWASMDRRLDVVGLAAQSLRLATPIGLGALAGILCERSGVVNIGIEGMMLTAACTGFIVALYCHNVWLGFAAAVAGGALMALLHAVLSVQFKVDQIVSGTVINILAVGVTGFMRRAFLLNNPLEPPGLMPIWRIPFISDIPAVGKILFSHQPMVYAMLILVAAVHLLLFYSVWGLRTRAVGEHPRAADTLGIDVYKIRYINVVAGGMIAGLAGAWFSLETVGNFEELMTGGRGFIALAAMIFGKWHPFGALGSAVLFGFADALQIKLQIIGLQIPYQLLGMAPYIITMIVLAGFVGRAVAPAADGVPYEREG